MPSGGQRVRAVDFTTSVNSTQNTSGTTTSTSYTATLTGGTACGVAFVAPTSGRVAIVNTADQSISAAGQAAHLSFAVRQGSTIGSGTSVLGAADDRSMYVVNDSGRQSFFYMLSGLTAGGSYNVQQNFRTSNAANTATFQRKTLDVFPLP